MNEERIKMIKAMEFIISHAINEDALAWWRENGIEKESDARWDAPLDALCSEYFSDDGNFGELIQDFSFCLHMNKKSGFCCDNVYA